VIAAAALQRARRDALASGRRPIELLEEQLGCGRAEFVARLAGALAMPALDFEQMRALAPEFGRIAYAEALRRGCVALRGTDGVLAVALGDPYDADLHDWIEGTLREPFAYRVAHRLDIAAFLAMQETGLRALDGIDAGEAGAPARQDAAELSIESISGTDSPVVRLVDSTLYDALRAGASDVHLESTATGLAIRYRIDGVLSPAKTLPGVELAEQVVSRVKVVSELDIAERRVPQDGRFRTRREGRDIDIRVSVMPSVFGEDAVLRILDKQALSDQLHGLTLDQLGFDAPLIARLRRMSAEPHGMLLVTGPTGSGKTTTLYAAITEVNKGLDKIVTIEDPVEYQLAGVLQIPVNEQKGLSFARGLRSILRHDPDRIMVGEIRDPETAEIAVQSALTGHLVYTTVHANNAFDVLGRFAHMGVDAYNLVSALNAVLAQRLLRINCHGCVAAEHPGTALLADSQIAPAERGAYRFKRGQGCALCRGSGYHGRKAICELLVMNDELSELVLARAPARRLKDAARAAGTLPLREAALALVATGQTTLEEANRVTFVA
jgi:general secretion pathway protein E